jgi:lysozyme
MKLNNAGYRFIALHEGFKSKPYLCPAKIPTIGYGNTYYPDGQRVTLLDKPINEEEAFEMFKEIADRFAKKVSRLVTSPINQNQLNALVSFAYNLGVANLQKSTLLRKVNVEPNDPTIADEFKKWVRADGKVLKGLVKRRNDEVRVYFS